MCTCDFRDVTDQAVALDPWKRVRYSTGLVLGVDEFLQEELYLLEKHRLHNRALHGYGTVCGLEVAVRDSSNGPEVVVEPGLAVNPDGREIRVPVAQCGRLNDWLDHHREEVEKSFGSPPPGNLGLYLVLCYRECETDRVPIPGGPCRSLEDSSAPSRVADAFELALRLEPPEQIEEEIVRRFGDLLRSLEVTADPGGSPPGEFLTREELEDLVRGLLETGSPPQPSSPPLGSPPAGLRLHPDDAADFLRAAFRVWVTEVRPRLLGNGRNCASGPPGEGCILLARLDFEIEELDRAFRVVGTALDVRIDEEDRPYLLHTRLLQELLGWGVGEDGGVKVHAGLSGLTADDHPQYLLVNPGNRALVTDLDGGAHRVTNLANGTGPGHAVTFQQAVKIGDAAGGDLGATYPNPQVTGLQGRPVLNDVPAANEVLTWNGAAWEPRPAGGGVTVHAGLTGLTADDHPQYLLVNPANRALAADLDGGAHRVTNLVNGISAGHAVTFQQAVKVGDAAGGDLGGTYPNPQVTRLQGRPVLNQNPSAGEVLTWNGAAWDPSPLPVPPPPPPSNAEFELTRIVALSWRHGGASLFQFTLDGGPAVGVVVAFGRETVNDGPTVQVRNGSLDSNTFQLFVERKEALGLFNRLRIGTKPPIPVKDITVDGSGLIISANTETSFNAQGAALLFDPGVLGNDQFLRQLQVSLRCDFILDQDGRAVDGEHLRGTLPTGDRPKDSPVGVQGGLFESWVLLAVRLRNNLDLNLATREDLQNLLGNRRLPVIDRILKRRDEIGTFARLEDLRGIEGVTDQILELLRPQ